ncbi:DUF2799 domain-containing protein [Wenzhouxiangella marina]|uniref:Uncharacterized protein n=1 Tax=Wenzhouxiangella marina TaxID=1579979 RepID=A0A0K0XVD5_9GAMM|nr:DUF2799 domain-containing protein [Wenzhouxiangella marina]AKS41630.1 hypothetical protein WM2015_1256 [Wenzhouxiangella marina]MBB6086610.1 hypothetical protein [Wenzhouxiangella marina]
MRGRLVVLMTVSGLLSGCATMSPEQCMVADWYRLGEQDARQGRTPDYLAERAGACQEAGYEADTEAWYSGFSEGLAAFCTLDNGFRFGLEGGRYLRTCPPGWDADFEEGYAMGRGIYDLEQRVAQGQRELDSVDDRIEDELYKESPDPDRIQELRRQRERLERGLREDEVELATARGVAIGRGFNVQ